MIKKKGMNPALARITQIRKDNMLISAAGKARWKEFSDFPQYKKLYLHAFDRMLLERARRGKESKWKTAEEVFLWWMEDDNIPGQMSIEDFPDVMP